MAGRLAPVRSRSVTVLASLTLLLAVVTVLSVAMPAPTIAAQAEDPGKGLAKGHAKGVVIVGYEPGTSKIKRGQAALSVEATDVTGISPLAPDTVVMKLPPGQTVEMAIEKLEKQSGVKYAEPDYYVQPAETSNDTYYVDGSLWGMQGDTSTPANQYGSGAAEAWAAGAIGSKSVFVGLIDEGVQIDHPDLADNIWTNPFEMAANGIDDDGNGYVDDVHGWDFDSNDATVYDGPGDDHGTHVAGTIGARGGNGFGVAGINWKVTLIPVKFLGPSGGTISAAIAAIDYVTDLKDRHDLNIVATNNSWGYLHTAAMGEPSQALLAAIDRGGDRGILFVAAAGNDGRSTKTSESTPSFLPAGYSCITRADDSARGWDCIISVANIDAGGDLASTSNYGSTSVDLGAPGSSIRSTYPSGTYADMSGTSMATPHVAGAVALCASLDSSLSAATVRSHVLATGAPTASLSGRTVTGDRLDVGALVQRCGVSVPLIDGLGSSEATTALTGADLVGAPTSAYSADFPIGEVFGQSPAAGTTVANGSTVSYSVSLGVETVSVPTPAPTPDPTPPPQPVPTPQPEPVAVTVVVDDLSPQFIKRAGGWGQADSGYLRHSHWAPARAGRAKRIATWRPTLTAPGDYRIMVKIPSRDATTRRALYRTKTVDGWVKQRVDQAAARGKWVDLGTFRLTTTPAVKLTDSTGERTSLGRRVGFDAIRFVPAGQQRVSSDPATPADGAPGLPPAQAGSAAPVAETAADPTPPSDPNGDAAPTPTAEPTPDRTKQPAVEATPDSTKEPVVERDTRAARRSL